MATMGYASFEDFLAAADASPLCPGGLLATAVRKESLSMAGLLLDAGAAVGCARACLAPCPALAQPSLHIFGLQAASVPGALHASGGTASITASSSSVLWCAQALPVPAAIAAALLLSPHRLQRSQGCKVRAGTSGT